MIQPNFGMALCNKAKLLTEYAHSVEDPGTATLFLWRAHKDASAALATSAVYTDPGDQRNRELTKGLKEWIESVVDLNGVEAAAPLAGHEIHWEEQERTYREWCLANSLCLNPLNDLGAYSIASGDNLDLATHVVRLDAPFRYESFFGQMKQEFVSARWLLYEALGSKTSHFSDNHVDLRVTKPQPSLSLAVEKVKLAYRASYSIFDKIAFFINAYMELQIPEKQVSFRKVWRPEETKPLRSQFDLVDNWGFRALYWLSKDFFEKENDTVAEPQARGLSDIRNHIEHKYLRVTARGIPNCSS